MSGHNPKMNYQSDELQDVAALLRSLPQVAAPTNFDAMLKARIAQAKVEQKADVTALLQELPRIAAPSDFDFKLRARIAQAKSEKVSLLGWFSEVFGRTFSWAQAGAAMAAVALFVGVISFQMVKPVDKTIDAQANAGVVAVIPPTPVESIKPAQPSVNSETENVTVASTSIRNTRVAPISVKFATATPKPKDPSLKNNNITPEKEIVPVPEVHDDLIASNTVLIKHSSSGETRVVKVAEVSFGLQSASLRSNSLRGAQNVEIASAQVIY